MIRYGASAHDMQDFSSQEIFLERLKLLVVMAKALLQGYPMGPHRLQAFTQNARFIFYETMALTSREDQPRTNDDPPTPPVRDTDPDHLFLQRAQLLSIMCTSIAEGNVRGSYRKQALQDNLEHICTYLSEQPRLSSMPFLKVA